MTTLRHSTARARAHFVASGALLALLAACGSGDAGHDDSAHGDHEHGEPEHGEPEHDALRTDAHHVEGDHADCQDDVELPEGAARRYGIEAAAAREVVLVPTVSAPGHLAFPQGAVARVGSSVAGRIASLAVRSGDAVARGDVLLVIESPELGAAQSDYLQKRTLAFSTAPALELARDALRRARELHDSVQGISLSEVQRREAEVRAAERALELARAAPGAARERLHLLGLPPERLRELGAGGAVDARLELRSPIAGRVIELSATLGELVDPGKDRLLVLGDLSVLWAIAEVSETRLAEVAPDAPARVTVPALADAARAGRVAAVAATIEPATRTVEVRVELPNADGALLPGMFVQVEIDSSRGGAAPTLAVPDEAVLDIEGRPSVFVPVEADGSLYCRHVVEVGAPVGTHIPVLAGLAPGELVVVSGAFRLKAELGKSSAQHGH